MSTELLGLAEASRRRIVLIVDDLERWTVEVAKVDEEYALRQVLQTEPGIVLVGVSPRWSADRDPAGRSTAGSTPGTLGNRKEGQAAVGELSECGACPARRAPRLSTA